MASCVSYRCVNQVTRPFTFPIRRCDEVVDNIGPRKCYIMMDLNSNYWQVMLASLARDKTAFFSALGKHHWTVMPMGLTNVMAFFVCMLQDFQQQWDKEAASQGLQGCLSQVIVDDILLASLTANELLAYFRIVLTTLRHFCATVKLRKCRFFQSTTQFVGVDLSLEGNSLAHSKNDAFSALKQSILFQDLRMLIVMFWFYQKWLPLYEVSIAPWHAILSHQQKLLRSNPRQDEAQEQAELVTKLWESDPGNETLPSELKLEILAGPVLN